MELPDGTPIPSHLSVAWRDMTNDMGLFDNALLRVGTVVKKILPSDPTSINKYFTEYDVDVQEYDSEQSTTNQRSYRCIVATLFGGITDRLTYTLREPSVDSNGKPVAGSRVLIHCINGETYNAVIVGGIRAGEDKDDLENGHLHQLHSLFNGVDLLINDDGELIVTY